MNDSTERRRLYFQHYPVPHPLPKSLSGYGGDDFDEWAEDYDGLDPFGKKVEGWRVREAIRWHWRQLAEEAVPTRGPHLDLAGLFEQFEREVAPHVNGCEYPELGTRRWLGSAFDKFLGEAMIRRDEWSVSIPVKTCRAASGYGCDGTASPSEEALTAWCDLATEWGLKDAGWGADEKGWGSFTGRVTPGTVMVTVIRAMKRGETIDLAPAPGRWLRVRRESDGWAVGDATLGERPESDATYLWKQVRDATDVPILYNTVRAQEGIV